MEWMDAGFKLLGELVGFSQQAPGDFGRLIAAIGGFLAAIVLAVFRYLSKQSKISADQQRILEVITLDQEARDSTMRTMLYHLETNSTALRSIMEQDTRVNRTQAQNHLELFVEWLRLSTLQFFHLNLTHGDQNPDQRREDYRTHFASLQLHSKKDLGGFEYNGLNLGDFGSSLDEEFFIWEQKLLRYADHAETGPVDLWLAARCSAILTSSAIFLDSGTGHDARMRESTEMDLQPGLEIEALPRD